MIWQRRFAPEAAHIGTSQPHICVIERERSNRRSTVRRYVAAIGKWLR